MRSRTVLLLAPLVIASDAAIAAQSQASGVQMQSEEIQAEGIDVDEDRAEAVAVAVMDVEDLDLGPLPRRSESELPVAGSRPDDAPENELRIDLEEVRWTTPSKIRLKGLSMRWGVTPSLLVELNPHLERDDGWVEAEHELVVFRSDPEKPTQSIGAPNQGRLRSGIPLPEGPHWKMRDHRSRAYGTRWTIESLVAAFQAYGEAFPDGPPIHMGEISARAGGKARPHVSHRTGRDVDIGYILRPGALGDRHWRAATEDTFDSEKNWFLIKSLVDTGRVQTIFVSSRLQRLLIEEARKELTEEEVARYFRHARADNEDRPIIVHWKGHRDHMHVRFKCHPDNRRCYPNSR